MSLAIGALSTIAFAIGGKAQAVEATPATVAVQSTMIYSMRCPPPMFYKLLDISE